MPDPLPPEAEPRAPVVVKKYANRRLYDTATSAYVTLEDLSAMVKQGIDFAVQDARTGEDLTRQVLTQIIVEEENRGESLLPIQFLRQLIRFYGGRGPALLPTYLEMSLDAFTRQQETLREAFGPAPAVGYFEEQVRQNMALFERSMRMFTPFSAARPEEPAPPAAAEDDEIVELKRRMEEMSRQLEKLSKT
ncbi:MAG: polyhydroxyalkanoate synthesis repressor PhaR [Pseudomonadota bacterium]|nr:polyhydroxyalkanoate synthesis repressor PhaR [Pseudomonadota bacterium]